MSDDKTKRQRKPKVPKPHNVPEDLEAIVLEAVRTKFGVSASQLKKSLPKSHQGFDKEARELARELAHRGELHRWLKGKTEVFFGGDPNSRLDKAAPELFRGKLLTKAALKELIGNAAPQHERLLDEWLPRAIKRGLMFAHPGRLFGLVPPEPDIRDSLKAVFKALQKVLADEKMKGVSKQRIADALLSELGLPLHGQAEGTPRSGTLVLSTSQSMRDEFMATLQLLMSENSQQALLSVGVLRASLTMTKEQFDELALELSRDGIVSLYHHDHPNSLSDAERGQLIIDARGTHYIGIAPRRA